MNASDQDVSFIYRAIQLASEAERQGNLPIGAVICLDGAIVAEGMNSIWHPKVALTRHAEMEALWSVPAHLWPRSGEMTLFTTLEPCLMCAGAILLHQLGRLVFGALDPYGGAGVAVQSWPPHFRDQFLRVQWIGPVLPVACDPLYARVREMEHARARLPQEGRSDT